MKKNTLPVKIIFISENKAGQRIDNFFRTQFKSVPKSMIYRILRNGRVRVNKKRVKPKYKLVTGDKIRIPPIQLVKREKETRSLCLKNIVNFSKIVLYEDNYILALNKPSGIEVHNGSQLGYGLIENLRAIRPKTSFLELVHRLDRDTSGVLIVAKKRSALHCLHRQLYEKKMKKNYLALVRGYWKSHIKTIKIPLLKNYSKNGYHVVQVNPKGKLSETHFNVEERYKFATLLRCNPITGRTHQIRVHTQYLGHPIAIDNRYGDHFFDKKLIKTGLSRMFLHASSLKFTHPSTNETICIKAPLDEQLEQCIKILRSESMLDSNTTQSNLD